MANAAQSARDEALRLADDANAAREHAEEAAEFAQESLRGTREYIAQVLEPELAQERARRAALPAGPEDGEARRDRTDP